MKKLFVFLSVFCILFSLVSCAKEETAKTDIRDNVHATVDGAEITAEEINYFKTRLRANIINEYAEKYNISDFSDFWDTEYSGTTPTEDLLNRAVEEAADAKQKFLLMLDNGVYDDISFKGLKERAEKYNAEHKDAEGTVGIKTIDIESFYTYYISTGEMELKNILAEGELKPTEEEIAEAANENPELTENGVISRIVDEKYGKLISEKISGRQIEILY